MLLDALRAVFAPTGIIAKNDVGLRQLEGLPLEPRVWWGTVPERVAFEENGVAYMADLLGGQKTGFFFDQADNRAWMAERVRGATVLDVYAHLGGWALTAMKHGARAATAIDVSGPACAAIRDNAARNGVAVEVIEGDAREAMAGLGGSFDVVCVDPPAFAKNRKSAGVAVGAYKQVNQAAARLVAPGGLLFTSSCSHHVLPERFEEAVVTGIRAAGRRGVLVRRAAQGPDHPILPGVPETEYLKHRVFILD
jgi:23S rRNA (cytosine1962-C5)-methyltransferase